MGIMEELQSPHSFIITDKYRYYTCIMWAWYLKYGSNPLSDYILSDIAEQWSNYFRNVPKEERVHDRRHIRDDSG